MSDILKSLWDLRSAEYAALADTWATNERRFYGGPDAADDLLSFRFETDTPATAGGEEAATRALAAALRVTKTQTLDGYAARKRLAVWPDLMRVAAEKFVGALMEQFPTADGDGLDFGALGDPTDPATPAGMLWANADGVGSDARSLPAFVADEMEAAMATDWRWVFTEGPAEAPRSQADWADGKRPYLVGLSPLQIPFCQYTANRLDVAIWCAFDGGLREENGALTAAPEPYLYVMVRDGYTLPGTDLAGGWWHLGEDGRVLTRPDGTERSGTWRNGEIPLRRLYARRASKSGAHRPGAGQTGGMTQLGNVCALQMNLGSIAFYDLFTSGKRQRLVSGLSQPAAEYAAVGLQAGDPWVFAPDTDTSGASKAAQVYDTGEVSANEAIAREREANMKLGREILMREMTSAPDASGRAREVQFTEGNAPRLVAMAENVEEAVTGFLRDLEVRWMGTPSPSASLTMPRRFNLLSVAQALRPVVETLTSANVSAPSVFERWVWAALDEAGQVPADADEAKALRESIRAELSVTYERDAATLALDREAAAASPDPEARIRALAEVADA